MKKTIILSWFQKRNNSNVHTLIVAIGIVMIWRGVRGLLDKFLLPHHEFWSYVVGIVLGILVLYIDDSKIDELGHH